MLKLLLMKYTFWHITAANKTNYATEEILKWLKDLWKQSQFVARPILIPIIYYKIKNDSHVYVEFLMIPILYIPSKHQQVFFLNDRQKKTNSKIKIFHKIYSKLHYILKHIKPMPNHTELHKRMAYLQRTLSTNEVLSKNYPPIPSLGCNSCN